MRDEVNIKSIQEAIDQLEKLEQTPEMLSEIERLRKIVDTLRQDVEAKEGAWEEVTLARMAERPRARYYIEKICDEFIELHGDRKYRDDQAIVGGIGKIGDFVVTIIAQSRGMKAKENMQMNFGMAHPEGYRKALRLLKQAEKFHRPVICFIDTPGAYCGIGAEERGQAQAIAQNLFQMIRLNVPIISGVIGEGGSGGALALGIADKIFMQEHSVYSILSPEGFASILWKDASRAKEAASRMKLTANDLLSRGMIDDILLEPKGGAQKNPEAAADAMKQYLLSQLNELAQVEIEKLVEERYRKYRTIDE